MKKLLGQRGKLVRGGMPRAKGGEDRPTTGKEEEGRGE